MTTPCWLPSQPISDAVPSMPVKAASAGRMLKAQSYLLAGPLPGVGGDVPAAGAAVAGGSGANPASKPTATTRATAAAAFILPNMAVTLACLPPGSSTVPSRSSLVVFSIAIHAEANLLRRRWIRVGLRYGK